MNEPQSQSAAMTGAEWLARALHQAGTRHVFFVESILRRTLVECGVLGITRVLAHSEKAAAYMADGYARIAGRPGVCMAQSVGAANLAAGLQDAFLDRSRSRFRTATAIRKSRMRRSTGRSPNFRARSRMLPNCRAFCASLGRPRCRERRARPISTSPGCRAR